ncbi:hypothetical protein [Desulfovibrio sp. Huiquan2017]|uniref:hypothetical protein n=1 Tax=Desulfovibrio sp. Huiquan2017 TaxID=2816861 RepID=UPI001A932D65|nr:hypothetical protein [Desulfovibrio sp. Huiquan2017]
MAAKVNDSSHRSFSNSMKLSLSQASINIVQFMDALRSNCLRFALNPDAQKVNEITTSYFDKDQPSKSNVAPDGAVGKIWQEKLRRFKRTNPECTGILLGADGSMVLGMEVPMPPHAETTPISNDSRGPPTLFTGAWKESATKLKNMRLVAPLRGFPHRAPFRSLAAWLPRLSARDGYSAPPSP